jgi:hypothetical protein
LAKLIELSFYNKEAVTEKYIPASSFFQYHLKTKTRRACLRPSRLIANIARGHVTRKQTLALQHGGSYQRLPDEILRGWMDW